MENDPSRTDVMNDDGQADGLETRQVPANYYSQRRARYLAAVTGTMPVAEYVRQAVAEVDRRDIPRAFDEQ